MTLDERQQHLIDNGLATLHRGRLIPIIRGGDPSGDGGAGGDGGSGDAGAGDGGAGAGSGDGGAGGDRTFTQAELDRIVQERLARAKSTPPADYDELKAKAAKLDELEAANKTELEKAQERAAKAEADAAAAAARAQEILVNSAIITAAAGKLADPSDAVALIDRSKLELDKDGNPTNIAEVVAALVEAKPHLAAGSTNGSADQGARGAGGANQVTREQLAQMTPDEIAKADKEGRLANLLGAK